MKMLKDKDPIVRGNGASGLEVIGPNARDAVPALIETLKDKHKWPRTLAVYALAKIGQVSQVLPALVRALQDENSVYPSP